MANSLKAKIKKLKHDGHIDSAICEDLLLKLDGHDRELKAKVISDFAKAIRNHFKSKEEEFCFYDNEWILEDIKDIEYQLKAGGNHE